MGNTTSSLPPIPSGDPGPSVHGDTYDGKDQPGFSFGPELELVLIPRRDKWEEIRKASPETYKKFDQIPLKISKTSKGYSDVRLQWAQCVTLLLQFVLKDVVLVIYASDIPETKALKANGTYYRYWSVIHDAAIDVDPTQGEWSVEIVSRVRYTYGPEWKDEFGKVWGAIASYFEIKTENRGSTHVHLKQVPMVLSEAKSTSLAYAKAVSKFVVFWEPCVYLLAPKRRRIREHCRSNIIASMPLYTALQEAADRKGTYKEIFDHIDGFVTLEQVVEFMGPKGKDFAWNFLYLTTAKSEGLKPSGTIEYRRPPGSRSLTDVRQSVTMSLCFVYGAVRVPQVDLHLYESMASTPVVCSREPFTFNAAPLPDNLVQFGNDHFKDFVTCMRKCAEALGLSEYLLENISTE